jgi:hypothetical protein
MVSGPGRCGPTPASLRKRRFALQCAGRHNASGTALCACRSGGDRDVPRLGGDAAEPSPNGGVGIKSEPARGGDVRVGIRGDISDGVALGDEEVRLARPRHGDVRFVAVLLEEQPLQNGQTRPATDSRSSGTLPESQGPVMPAGRVSPRRQRTSVLGGRNGLVFFLQGGSEHQGQDSRSAGSRTRSRDGRKHHDGCHCCGSRAARASAGRGPARAAPSGADRDRRS